LTHDCGLIINPDGLRTKLRETSSRGEPGLDGRGFQFDTTGQKNLDWDSYPVIRFNQVPDVEIFLINQPKMQPLGGGEPSIVPTRRDWQCDLRCNWRAPAQGTFTPERVLAALKA